VGAGKFFLINLQWILAAGQHQIGNGALLNCYLLCRTIADRTTPPFRPPDVLQCRIDGSEPGLRAQRVPSCPGHRST
jgi:hypothetical protein